MFVGDSIVRTINRALNKGDDVVVCFPWTKNRGYHREGGKT